MPTGPARALDQPGVPISTGLVLVQDENASVAQAAKISAWVGHSISCRHAVQMSTGFEDLVVTELHALHPPFVPGVS